MYDQRYVPIFSFQNTGFWLWFTKIRLKWSCPFPFSKLSTLLCLLAKINCSICSYQFNRWYSHIVGFLINLFLWQEDVLELARSPHVVLGIALITLWWQPFGAPQSNKPLYTQFTKINHRSFFIPHYSQPIVHAYSFFYSIWQQSATVSRICYRRTCPTLPLSRSCFSQTVACFLPIKRRSIIWKVVSGVYNRYIAPITRGVGCV